MASNVLTIAALALSLLMLAVSLITHWDNFSSNLSKLRSALKESALLCFIGAVCFYAMCGTGVIFIHLFLDSLGVWMTSIYENGQLILFIIVIGSFCLFGCIMHIYREKNP